MQKGIRAERETAFYAEIEQLRSDHSGGIDEPDSDELEFLVHLAKFVPLSCELLHAPQHAVRSSSAARLAATRTAGMICAL
jgi:hypothetical protein